MRRSDGTRFTCEDMRRPDATVPAGRVQLRAGYSAVPDFSAAGVNVDDLVLQAESALDHIPRGSTLISFDELRYASPSGWAVQAPRLFILTNTFSF